jgi:hypothetical protein
VTVAAAHAKQVSDVTRGWGGASSVRSELKRLPDVLVEGERLVNVDRGECTGRRGLLALTDTRLLFLRERMFKSELDEYPLEEVRTLDIAQPFFGGPKLVVDLDNGQVEFKGVDRVRAKRIVDYVHARSTTSVNVPPEATPQDVKTLKRNLGYLNRALLYGAFRRLHDVLEGGESLGPATYATLENEVGLLLATNRRLVFVSNDSSKPASAWRYRDVRGIEQPDAGSLVVLASARRTEFAAVNAGRGEPIVGHVRQRLGIPAPEPDQIDDVLKTAVKGPEPAKPPPPEPPPPPHDPIDVNSASADELDQGLGLDRATADRAVHMREQRGGFGSVEDFADALDLMPHVRRAVMRSAVAEPMAPPEPPRDGFGDIELG